MKQMLKNTLIAVALLGCVGAASMTLAHENAVIVAMMERIAVLPAHDQKQLTESYSRYRSGQASYVEVLEQENEKLLAILRDTRSVTSQKGYEKALHSNFRELLAAYEMQAKAKRDVEVKQQRAKALYLQVQTELMHRNM